MCVECYMSSRLHLNKPASSQKNDAISLNRLLKGKRYTWIQHAGETYLLQLTKSNKLLLTK